MLLLLYTIYFTSFIIYIYFLNIYLKNIKFIIEGDPGVAKSQLFKHIA